MSFGKKKKWYSEVGSTNLASEVYIKKLRWIWIMTISSQTFSMPLPPIGCWHDMWRRVTVISRHSTKAWNDLGVGGGWPHGPMWGSWKVWFLLNPDMLAISTWSLTINQQPLWQSCVFQMTSFLRLPLKWSDSQGKAGAKRIVRHRLWNSSLLCPS